MLWSRAFVKIGIHELKNSNFSKGIHRFLDKMLPTPCFLEAFLKMSALSVKALGTKNTNFSKGILKNEVQTYKNIDFSKGIPQKTLFARRKSWNALARIEFLEV